jgi:stearoyl-CoA desaturase (delta-9 desaturase)
MVTRSRRTDAKGVVVGVGLALVHVGALAAFIPGTFSWSAVAVAAVLYYATGAWGICLGFHRVLTHRSLALPRPLEALVAVLGVLALQGGPIDWIATHRKHHAHSDREGDPHDIHRGYWWSHVAWLYRRNPARVTDDEMVRLAPDLSASRFYRLLENSHVWWTVGLGLVLLAIGGWSWVIWGIFVRAVVSYHATWFVNSAAHYSGYRTYNTGDRSTNNWWVALVAWGEGWHNNHHAFPFSARHGLRWFEVDLTWLTIKALGWLRIARDIKLPTPAMLARLSRKATAARPQQAPT